MSVVGLLYELRSVLNKDEEESWKFLKETLDGFIGVDAISKKFCKAAVAMVAKNSSRKLDLNDFEKLMKDIIFWTVSNFESQ